MTKEIVSAASAAKTGTVAFLAAHPVGVAVVGAALIGGGAYYLGKKLAERAAAKGEVPVEEAAAA